VTNDCYKASSFIWLPLGNGGEKEEGRMENEEPMPQYPFTMWHLTLISPQNIFKMWIFTISLELL
jgi:hypothetical protein